MVHAHRLFLGNPGTGKSTLINCLIGQPMLQSGLSYGGGLTQDYQPVTHDGITYMDTPGLADTTIAEKAAMAITSALKQGGWYKLFFMIRLQNGRILYEDMATLERILDAIDLDPSKIKYSVVFNNVDRRQYESLQRRDSMEFDTIRRLVNARRFKTDALCFIPTLSILGEASNTITTLPPPVIDFINKLAPAMNIDPTSVRDIDPTGLAQQAALIRTEMEKVLQHRELLTTNQQRFQEELEREQAIHQELESTRWCRVHEPTPSPSSHFDTYLPLTTNSIKSSSVWTLSRPKIVIAVVVSIIVALVIAVCVLATRRHGDPNAEAPNHVGCVPKTQVNTKFEPLYTAMNPTELAAIARYQAKTYIFVQQNDQTIVAFANDFDESTADKRCANPMNGDLLVDLYSINMAPWLLKGCVNHSNVFNASTTLKMNTTLDTLATQAREKATSGFAIKENCLTVGCEVSFITQVPDSWSPCPSAQPNVWFVYTIPENKALSACPRR